MKSTNCSLSRRMRLDLLLAIIFFIGIIGAIVIPGNRSIAVPEQNLFTLMEKDYTNPLFSSASAIRILNGAAKQVARFAGYDEFRARIDLQQGTTLAAVTRFSGDLLSMLDVHIESRDNILSNEPLVYISESFWERAFARTNGIIGTILRVNQAAYRVAGVTRNGAGFLRGTEIWMPVRSRSPLSELNSMRIIGSLTDPGQWEKAQREITSAIKEYLSDQPYFNSPGPRFVPVVNQLHFTESLPIVAGRTWDGHAWAGS